MDKETLRFYNDVDQKLDRMVKRIQRDSFPLLDNVKINCVFRTVASTDGDGYMVLGEARKLPNRVRDLYGYDFEITIFDKVWENLDKREKERLIWHELNHCKVLTKPNTNVPLRDGAERVKISLNKHDVVIKTFIEELYKFGPTKPEKKAIEHIVKYAGKKNQSKIRRR